MATVTGKTSEKIDELFGETLVGANLDTQGALTFMRKNGSTINAGSLGTGIIGAIINSAKHLIFTTRQGDQIDAGSIAPDLLAAWPVGSVYFSVDSANPSTKLGGGTWARIAQGRMIVGVDSGDTMFDSVKETGGAKSKTLVAANLPAHAHTMAHTHSIAHGHSSASVAGPAPASAGSTTAFTRSRNDDQINAGGMVGDFGGNSGASSAPNTGTGPGTSTAFDVMNPFITAYIWERTA